MRSLILLALCACAAAPPRIDREDVRTLLARIVPADAPRALAVVGEATDAATPMSSYAYLFGQRTQSNEKHLSDGSPVCYGLRSPYQTRTLPYYRNDGCYAGKEFVASWALNIGHAPGPWPRQAWVLARSLRTYDRDAVIAIKAGRVDLTPFGYPGVVLPFVPTMSFECGNSLGLVEHDASGRVVLRWTPPDVAVGSVWFVCLLWVEPTGLMVSRAIEFRVGRRP